MSHHILSKVPVSRDDVDESERDCEQTEKDVGDCQVRDEYISRRHHFLINRIVIMVVI